MPYNLGRIARSSVMNPVTVQVGMSLDKPGEEGAISQAVETVEQRVEPCHYYQKRVYWHRRPLCVVRFAPQPCCHFEQWRLLEALRATPAPPVLIFCNSAISVDKVSYRHAIAVDSDRALKVFALGRKNASPRAISCCWYSRRERPVVSISCDASDERRYVFARVVLGWLAFIFSSGSSIQDNSTSSWQPMSLLAASISLQLLTFSTGNCRKTLKLTSTGSDVREERVGKV
jgi:hypothetical protein